MEENFCRRKERNFKASAWASSSKIRGVNCSATMPAPNKLNWGVFLQSKPFVNIISFLHATLHYMLRNSMHESLYHNRVFRLNTAWFLETIRIHSLSQCHPAFWMEHIGRRVRVLNSQYFWVKMSQVQQSSISTWEAIWAQWSLLPLSENMYWTYGQLKAEDPPFTLAFVVSQATPFGARHTGQKHHWSTDPLHYHFQQDLQTPW